LAPRKGKESLFNFIGVEDELNNTGETDPTNEVDLVEKILQASSRKELRSVLGLQQNDM
jgi:hypothetical protein